jgi:molecular chaperone HscA
MLQSGFSEAEADMQRRALQEARVEGDRMLLATASALDADADLLDEAERAAVDGLMRQLRERITSDDTAAIEAATKSLAEGTELLAARRMNRGIQQALTGRRLDEI